MGYVFGAVAGGAMIAGANMVQEARRATERAGLRERALDERLRGALATIASRDSALQVVELELSAARTMALTVAETPLASRDSFVVALAGQVPLTPIAAAGFSE